MWTQGEWDEFASYRLPRWMTIFEETGARHDLADTGHMLGTDAPSLADLATGTLLFTMADKLPGLGGLLRESAPRVADLSDRMAHLPAIAELRTRTDAAYGAVYCGGQIEQSLRAVLTGSR